MRLQKIDSKELKNFEKSLKKCSKNDSGEPVTQLEYNAYAFDNLSTLEGEKYCRKKKLRSERTDYFLIYNEEAIKNKENASASFDKLKQTMGSLAKDAEENRILGNMEIYKGTFYREVHTIDVTDFENKFAEKIFS